VNTGNDNRPAEQLAAIVAARKRRARKAALVDGGAATPESVKASWPGPADHAPSASE
jgi:hypothetical protein